jgi:hypothetical protein
MSDRTMVVVWQPHEDGHIAPLSATVGPIWRDGPVPRVDIRYDFSGGYAGGLRIEPAVTHQLVKAGVLKGRAHGSSAWAYAIPEFRIPFLRKLKPLAE